MNGGLILPCYSCLCGWAKDYLLFGSCPDDATLEALRFAPPTEEEEAEKPQPAGKGRKKRSAPATTARAEAAEKAVKKSRKK